MGKYHFTWRHIRRTLFWIRLGLMVALFGFAMLLLQWNRQADPRFFVFLKTPPGKALARVMNWPNLYDQVEQNRPRSDFTEEELIWLQKLEDDLESRWPTHTLVLTDGSKVKARILAEFSDRIRIMEHFGSRGRMETTLPRSRIRSIHPYPTPPPQVCWKDVQFQMEFPSFELTYAGHYTVLTDAPYYQVAASVEALEHLRDQYLDVFADLIRFPRPDESLQLLYFTREADYRAHQEATAPDLASSLGFYSPLEDRMVMFNHEYSDQAQALRDHVRTEVNDLVGQTRSGHERTRLRHLQDRLEDQIRDRASMETLATLRHEGAHHLSYSYGVHSWIHAENAWLIEGLATYFESPVPGQTVPAYAYTVRELKQAGRLPDLATFVGVRLPGDFSRDLPEVQPHEAYALSWSLFRFCMHPRHRDGFFDYLRDLQDPEEISELMRIPRLERLAVSLGMTPRELENQWRKSI